MIEPVNDPLLSARKDRQKTKTRSLSYKKACDTSAVYYTKKKTNNTIEHDYRF